MNYYRDFDNFETLVNLHVARSVVQSWQMSRKVCEWSIFKIIIGH